MITFDRIKSNIADVTSEQIGKCHKIIDMTTGEDFYLVENSKGEVDNEGDIIEYKVQYSSGYGFTCTCPSGEHGFSNVRHASGCCWHVRAAVACFLEEEAAMQEMCAKINAEEAAKAVASKMSSIEAQMPAWIMNAKPAPHMRRAPKELR